MLCVKLEVGDGHSGIWLLVTSDLVETQLSLGSFSTANIYWSFPFDKFLQKEVLW